MTDVKGTTESKFRYYIYLMIQSKQTKFKDQIESHQTLKDFNKHLQQSLENANQSAQENAKEYDRSKQAWQQSLDEERDSNQALKNQIENLKQQIQIFSAQS